MTFPLLLFAVIPVFLVLFAVAIVQRPPNTPRGRAFFVATGVLGICAGGVLLMWCLAMSSTRTKTGESYIRIERFLGPQLPGVIIGGAGVLFGLGYCARAAFGKSPPEP